VEKLWEKIRRLLQAAYETRGYIVREHVELLLLLVMLVVAW
jgi:hypothetical protein